MVCLFCVSRGKNYFSPPGGVIEQLSVEELAGYPKKTKNMAQKQLPGREGGSGVYSNDLRLISTPLAFFTVIT